MKKLNFFLLIVMVVLISSFLTFLAIDRSKIVQVNSFVMDVNVSDDGVFGINIDPDGFHFGSIGRGQGATKVLMIKNVKEDVSISIIKKGEMAGWVSSPKGLVMRKGQDENVSLSIAIPYNAQFGGYTGEVMFVLRKI